MPAGELLELGAARGELLAGPTCTASTKCRTDLYPGWRHLPPTLGVIGWGGSCGREPTRSMTAVACIACSLICVRYRRRLSLLIIAAVGRRDARQVASIVAAHPPIWLGGARCGAARCIQRRLDESFRRAVYQRRYAVPGVVARDGIMLNVTEKYQALLRRRSPLARSIRMTRCAACFWWLVVYCSACV